MAFQTQGKKTEQIFLFSVKQKSNFPWLFLAREGKKKRKNILFEDFFFSIKAESSNKILAASTFSPFHFSLLD